MGIITGLNNRMGNNNFPPAEIADRWEWIAYYDGLLKGSDEYVRNEAYKRNMGGAAGVAYVAQPVPYALSQASSNLLFGEPVQFKAGDENDQTNLERIINDNKLQAQCRAAGITSSALGEVYIKVTVDPTTRRGKSSPVIQFITPERVIPVFNAAGELESAKIVTTWDDGRHIYRLFECHEEGFVYYELFSGSRTSFGAQVGVETFEHTQDKGLSETPVDSGIDELCIIHIPNALQTSNPFGISDYANGIDNLFYAFNDATSIAHRATQAGVPFTVVPRELLDENQNLSHEKTIIAVNKLADTLGEGDITKMIETVQHQANQDKFMAYAEQVLDLLFTFAGISPQSMGRSVDGGATSGTALKLKMAATLATAAGKAGFYEDGLSQALSIAARLDQDTVLSGNDVKEGNDWTDADAIVSVKIQDGLPEDEMEIAKIIQTLKSAGAISLKEAVKRANPNSTEEQIEEELAAIQGDMEAETAAIGAALPTLDGGALVGDLNAALGIAPGTTTADGTVV